MGPRHLRDDGELLAGGRPWGRGGTAGDARLGGQTGGQTKVRRVVDAEAPPAMREWAVKLEAKPKYVVSSTRTDFPWSNSHHIASDLRTSVQRLKGATPAGVLLGSGKLATELDRLDLIDEYKFLVHPRIAGHGPTLYQNGLPSTRRLELDSAKPLRSGAVAMHYRRARG